MPQDLPFIGDAPRRRNRRRCWNSLPRRANSAARSLFHAVPADRIDALRRAFDATMKDKEILAEADKQGLPVHPVGGVEAMDIVKKIYGFPPGLLAKARKAAE